MAASGKAYPMLAKSLGDKLIDVDSDTLKVALFSAYTYDAPVPLRRTGCGHAVVGHGLHVGWRDPRLGDVDPLG
jgi:hypothetical protein